MIPFILAIMVCGVLNWGYAYVLGFGLIFVCYPLMKRKKLLANFIVSPAFWIMAAFGLTYVVIGGASFNNIQNALILPLVAYIIGWCSFEQGGRRPEVARDNIIGISVGFALHAGLNYLANTGYNRGQLVDFWNGSYRSATGSGCLNTLVFSLLIYTLFLEKRRRVKLLLVVLTAICVLYMLMLGNRTQLLILVVVSLISGALLIRERGSWKRFSKLLIALTAVGVLFSVSYRFNLAGISDLIDQSNLVARFTERNEMGKSNLERTVQFLAGLQNLYQNPFGGQKSQMYFHNMWLDISRIAGIIPMVFMLLYDGIAVRNTLRLFRNKRINTGTRFAILCVYIGCLLNCSVEPVLEGLTSFFLVFCLINGITESLNYSCKLWEKNGNQGENCYEFYG